MCHGDATFGRIAAFLLVLLMGLPLASEAAVFWTDDFENHLYPNWITSPCTTNLGTPAPAEDGCNPGIGTDVVHSGTHSLKSHYPGPLGTQAGTFIDRQHTPSADVWMRFYYRTTNFTYMDTVQTKHFYNLSPSGGTYMIWVNQAGSREFSANIALNEAIWCDSVKRNDMSCKFYPNKKSIPLRDDVWYCIETHVNQGSPGISNGTIEVFIDGTQTLGYYNVMLSGSNTPKGSQQFNALRHYAQFGKGDRYIDQLAVGNTRIGCTEPAASIPPPQNLKVQ